MSENRFDVERLRASVLPLRLHWFPRLRSTNDHAIAMRARGDLYAPAIVLAGAQTAGRGRNSANWWSAAGSITMTMVLAAQEQLALHQLPLIAGLAVREAVAELTGEPRIGLKWPNDLVFRGRKLAGLLCERVDRADLIGVGVNVNDQAAPIPTELRARAAFLSQIAHRQVDKTDALIVIVRRLHSTLSRRAERPFGMTLREYDRYHDLRGRRVIVWINRDVKPLRGTCEGLDGAGRLLVRRGGSKHRIVAGHVQVR